MSTSTIVPALIGGGTFTLFAGFSIIHPGGLWGYPLTKIANPKNQFVITFDDGPAKPWTMKVLDCLAQWNARASFFVLGEELQKYPDIAKQIVSQGHQIEVHGFRHVLSPLINPTKLGQELIHTTEVIAQITGRRPRWFRPPYGVRPLSNKPYRLANLNLVTWSWSAQDWQGPWGNPCGKPVPLIKAGDIILLHDGFTKTPNARERTIEALNHLLSQAHRDGLSSVPLDIAMQAQQQELVCSLRNKSPNQ